LRARVIRHLAAAEFRAVVRARWSGGFAAAFGMLTLLLSYFGMVHAGFSGFVGFARTSMSLLSLVTLLVPLVALALGAVRFSGERESLQLLVAQPVSRAEVLVGRYLGMLGALELAVLVGFGAAGLVIGGRAGLDGWLRYLVMVALSMALMAICLALGAWVGVVAQERSRALGGAIVLWGALVVVYDLLVMGITAFLSGGVVRPLLLSMVLANPVDLVRVLGLLAVGARASLGAPGAVLAMTLAQLGGRILLPLAFLMWLGLPLFGAYQSFRETDL